MGQLYPRNFRIRHQYPVADLHPFCLGYQVLQTPNPRAIYLIKKYRTAFAIQYCDPFLYQWGIGGIEFFASATTLGLFSLAERISMVLRMFPAMVIHSIFPNASKLLKEDLSAFISYLKKVSFVAFAVGLTVSLAVFGLAPVIIQLFSKGICRFHLLFASFSIYPIFGLPQYHECGHFSCQWPKQPDVQIFLDDGFIYAFQFNLSY